MTFKNRLFEKLKVYLVPEFLRYQLYFVLYKYRTDYILSDFEEFAIWLHIAWNLEKTLNLALKSWGFKTYLVSQFSEIFFLRHIFTKTKQLSDAVCSKTFDELAKFYSSKVAITSENLILVRNIFLIITQEEI